jgi:hypothetical protein
MRSERGALRGAGIFFGCGVVAVAAGFWTVARSQAVPTTRLAPGLAFSLMMLALYIGATIRAVRRLTDEPPAIVQQRMLTVAGLGLFLVSLALSLR